LPEEKPTTSSCAPRATWAFAARRRCSRRRFADALPELALDEIDPGVRCSARSLAPDHRRGDAAVRCASREINRELAAICEEFRPRLLGFGSQRPMLRCNDKDDTYAVTWRRRR
jgi:hypothetical protein